MDQEDNRASINTEQERRLLRLRKNIQMVGSAGEESVNLNMNEAGIELEADSEAESGEEDTRQLITQIPSSIIKGMHNNNNRKIVNQNQSLEADDESVWSITIQMFIPFLLAGFGMVAASLLLDVVQVNLAIHARFSIIEKSHFFSYFIKFYYPQHWPVFQVVSEVYILVPALLGLKGNLEMTLASRLSTQANLGHMDTRNQQWTLIVGNLALIQCQAMVVGLLASLAAVILGWIPEAQFDINHGLLLCASSLVTASVASFILGLVMVAVILLSRRMNINPDNVATPIAASLGDLTTLALLAWVASLLYNAIGKFSRFFSFLIPPII